MDEETCPYNCDRAKPWDLECPDCGAEMEDPTGAGECQS